MLRFTPNGVQAYVAATDIGGWSAARAVSVTGADDTILDFTPYYTIVTGNLVSTDPDYNNVATADVNCAYLDYEVPPSLPT